MMQDESQNKIPEGSDWSIKPAEEQHWSVLFELLENFNLDRTAFDLQKCLVCVHENEVLGLVRLKSNYNCEELCSLGVIPEMRGKGIGKALCRVLLNMSSGPLFLVTEIPAYFERMGFRKASSFPEALKDKQKRCLEIYDCKEAIVMKYENEDQTTV